MVYDIIFPVFISFIITAILGPIVIPILRKAKFGQTEREELKSHQVKNGTPTMGGIMILLSVLITCLIYMGRYPKIVPVLLLTIGFGIIGFIDDYLKVVLRRSDGLLAWQKMLCQIVVTTIFLVYMIKVSGVSLTILIPFTGYYLNIGWLAVVLLYFAVIGTVNGVNFTDGVDGLVSCVTLMVAVFLTIVSLVTKAGVSPISCAFIGALLGFLLYNAHPAKVFMGDTGSLALGGFVAGMAYMMQMPIFILIIGLIYVVEVLSVIIQVTYFKKTGGKRIFKMAPIHHHFELSGWSETQVVAVFTIVTALLCMVAYLGI
ncbi:MAG: phospho-N-acetylmuramoyl-pentapeptide-transferase [Lachnospiraceae bacterium]|nr:phospho-N-acetylmuramoyl-pentapeptide-transferase [Lachnospiraceae bacterium]